MTHPLSICIRCTRRLSSVALSHTRVATRRVTRPPSSRQERLARVALSFDLLPRLSHSLTTPRPEQRRQRRQRQLLLHPSLANYPDRLATLSVRTSSSVEEATTSSTTTATTSTATSKPTQRESNHRQIPHPLRKARIRVAKRASSRPVLHQRDPFTIHASPWTEIIAPYEGSVLAPRSLSATLTATSLLALCARKIFTVRVSVSQQFRFSHLNINRHGFGTCWNRMIQGLSLHQKAGAFVLTNPCPRQRTTKQHPKSRFPPRPPLAPGSSKYKYSRSPPSQPPAFSSSLSTYN
ncbi:hypothetical protein BJ875DRAFT_109653 [Amylocarpus encephaloides]|uniref:Uncharacterized protein n=1 Tax=Amylocarpus encephaloides TaxID=45428 RepID=A0A9P7YDJ7_9HELO|nr:hypothetical protein BJ875DRAFT_109653 [Amylocarpus encephaloides]